MYTCIHTHTHRYTYTYKYSRIHTYTYLAVFIRGFGSEFTITEELLFLVPMKGTTTGKDLCNAVLNVMVDFNLDYKLLKGITTDGDPSMTGKIDGFVCDWKNMSLTWWFIIETSLHYPPAEFVCQKC